MAFQEKIFLPSGIVGILTFPAVMQKKAPAILMLHGFGMNKDEVGNAYLLLAQQLAENGIASFRIDFHGYGESNGSTEDTTIDSLIQDAVEAYQYLSSLEIIDTERLGVCGFSLGAGIAALSTKMLPENTFKVLLGISPAGDLKNDFLAFLGDQVFKKVTQENGPYEIDLGWRKIILGKNFFESLERHDPKKAILTYKGALFTIAGSKDFTAHHAKSFVDLSPSLKKKAVIIDDTDHIFQAFDTLHTHIPEVIEGASQWVRANL